MQQRVREAGRQGGRASAMSDAACGWPRLPVIENDPPSSCPTTEVDSPTSLISVGDDDDDRELSVRASRRDSALLSSASAPAPPAPVSSQRGRSRSPIATTRSAATQFPGVIRVVSSGRFALLPVSQDSGSARVEESLSARVEESSAGSHRGVDQGGVQEVSGSQGVGQEDPGEDAWWWASSGGLEDVVGTQRMNGSAHPDYVDVNAREPDSFVLDAWEAMPIDTPAMPIDMLGMMSANVQLGSSGVTPSSALAVCGLLHRVLVPTPAAICNLESDTESSNEQLVSKGVEVSGRLIRATIASGNSFYIGITENPSRRWDEHVQGGGLWDRMEVLVRACSSAITAPIERELVAAFNYAPLCHNSGQGGERASAGMPHFVYMLIGPPLLRRR